MYNLQWRDDMTSFIKGLLLVIMAFCFCAGISLFISVIITWFKEKTTPPKPQPTKPTIYYVEQTKKSKRKKPRKKTVNVALKGLMITPEKFETIKNNEFENI